ncbi:MAG: hypothetical protein ACREUX_12720 [Burkholderiales bacterium]
MGHRINVMIDDPVWLELQKVPQGERSRLISEAVSREMQRRGRVRAAAEMDRLRKTRRSVAASAEDLIRADRDAHW